MKKTKYKQKVNFDKGHSSVITFNFFLLLNLAYNDMIIQSLATCNYLEYGKQNNMLQLSNRRVIENMFCLY